MNCPICGKPMVAGKLYGDQWALRWYAHPERRFFGMWRIGGQRVGRSPLHGFALPPFAVGYKCGVCKKIILDA